MKRILVTQRVDFFDDIKEVRESLDIRILKLIRSIDMLPIQISFSAVNASNNFDEYINSFNPNGILLSGGNNIGQFPERDDFERKVIAWSSIRNIPIFGICRGLQVLNNFCNGSLKKVKGHCNTRHLIYGDNNFNNRQVNSYHNYGVIHKTLGNNLKPIAKTEDGCIEAIKHDLFPWKAIMWHPEREAIFNKKDLEIIQNHFN